MCEHSTKVRCGRAVEERVLRSGARALLAQAIEAEVSGFLGEKIWRALQKSHRSDADGPVP